MYGKSTLGTITIVSHVAHVHTLSGTLVHVHTHTRTYHAGREELQAFQCTYFYLNFKWFIVCVDFEDVMATVAYVMKKRSGCVFWTTYQERR